ncbi:hypothetical protein [Pseudomonas benzenivorans]|uniref:Lipoprotein n=1 Tax=Pseudomonas benzenivorans TaxID=556533 RepID=A0ABY5H579_9PSED|nr:hypothetical protein [Pseudomonas benzenivorans]UTW07012.1 hypothetical protein KDW96_17880 [Pseudomonas benzenivorans]
MLYKYMLAAVLGLSMTGCAVYGGGYDHGYRGHDRYYPSNRYQVQRYPVYVAPRYYSHDARHYDSHRHDDKRYDGRRYDQRRYLPAPSPRMLHDERRAVKRIDGRRDHRFDRRRAYRSAEPRPGWRGQHLKLQERTPRYQGRHEGRHKGRRDGRRRHGY